MPAVRVVALGGCGGLLDSLGVAHLPLNLLESGGDRFRGGLRLILLSEGRVSHPALVLWLVNLLLMSLFGYSRLLLLGGFGSLNRFGVLVALLGKSNLLLLFLFLGGLFFLLSSGSLLFFLLGGADLLFLLFNAGSAGLFFLFFSCSGLLLLFLTGGGGRSGIQLIFVFLFFFLDLLTAINFTVRVVGRMRANVVQVLMIAIGCIVTVTEE